MFTTKNGSYTSVSVCEMVCARADVHVHMHK